jgi:hypothetical protein
VVLLVFWEVAGKFSNNKTAQKTGNKERTIHNNLAQM